MATHLRTVEPTTDPKKNISLPGWLYLDSGILRGGEAAFLRAAPQVVCHESEIAEPGEWRTHRISWRKRDRHSRRRRRGAGFRECLPAPRIAAGRRRRRLRQGADLPLSRLELCPGRAAGRRAASPRISGAGDGEARACSRSRSRIGTGSCSSRSKPGAPSVAEMMAPYELRSRLTGSRSCGRSAG